MPDKVELFVNKMRIEHFMSYKVDADLYTPADAFSLDLANPEAQIKAGHQCELQINGTLEMTGIIDKVTRKIGKNGVSLAVEGRDLMGLLIDSFCAPKDWIDLQNIKLKALAERLLMDIPFIELKNIDYQENVVGKLKSKKKSSSGGGFLSALDGEQKIAHIDAGMTIFEVLRNYSLSRGMLFYCEPSGRFVFGRPLAKGEPSFSLTLRKSGRGNNVIESETVNDISRRYSKVLVVGQQQGNNETAADQINISGSHEDSTYPFQKLYVTRHNDDSVSPNMRARMIMEKQRREGAQLTYTVGRHQQNGINWSVNSICRVVDEAQNIEGDYLIYGRTFEMNKQTGPITRLRLGAPGIVA